MFNSLLITKVFAAAVPADKPIVNLPITSLYGFFTFITNAIIIVGLGLVVVFLALGFIQFITSQGDKLRTETAQKWVTYAVLGGVGLFAVYAIKSVILNLMGVKDPTTEY
jgi:hypothetical protein